MEGSPPAAEAQAADTGGRPRDWLIDNCRAILIVLVVSGHVFMTYHGDTRVMALLHYFVYTFHMPAFAFFSGYVITSPRRTANKAVHALLPLYLGLSVVHVIALRLFFGTWQWNIFVAPGLLWYLLALMWWRMALPRLDRLRYIIPISLAASLLVGFSPYIGSAFALSRTIVFLPFFLMGYRCPRDWRDKVRAISPVWALAALGFIGAVALWLTLTKWLPIRAFTAYTPYGALANFSVARGLASRVIMLACSGAAIFALVRLLPDRRTRFSYVGTHSLTVYILQMYFIYTLQVTYPHLGVNPVIDSMVLVSPIPVSLLLATAPARVLITGVERISQLVLSPLASERPTVPQES